MPVTSSKDLTPIMVVIGKGLESNREESQFDASHLGLPVTAWRCEETVKYLAGMFSSSDVQEQHKALKTMIGIVDVLPAQSTQKNPNSSMLYYYLRDITCKKLKPYIPFHLDFIQNSTNPTLCRQGFIRSVVANLADNIQKTVSGHTVGHLPAFSPLHYLKVQYACVKLAEDQQRMSLEEQKILQAYPHKLTRENVQDLLLFADMFSQSRTIHALYRIIKRPSYKKWPDLDALQCLSEFQESSTDFFDFRDEMLKKYPKLRLSDLEEHLWSITDNTRESEYKLKKHIAYLWKIEQAGKKDWFEAEALKLLIVLSRHYQVIVPQEYILGIDPCPSCCTLQ